MIFTPKHWEDGDDDDDHFRSSLSGSAAAAATVFYRETLCLYHLVSSMIISRSLLVF
jgi:hypothetical protein